MSGDGETGNSKDLARYRLEIAKEDLNTAYRNLEEADYRAANNRAYYAIFHAIEACLALDSKGYKRHGQTIGEFNRNYILKDIFPKEFGRKINEAEEIRRKSDYDDFYIVSIEKTKSQVEFANEAVKIITEYVLGRIDNED